MPPIPGPSLVASESRQASAPIRPTALINLNCTRTSTVKRPALSPSDLNDTMPSQIVPHMYVGNQEQTNRETINKLNIRYILSLGLLPTVAQGQHQKPILMPVHNSSADFKIKIRSRGEIGGVKQMRSVYCKCINIADNSDQELSKFFDEAFLFIEEARRKKCNILIHCLAGISRSPTIAIAYLMRLRTLHWRDAYDLVKRCRPQIDPNLNFMGQLMSYNRSLRDEKRLLSTTKE